MPARKSDAVKEAPERTQLDEGNVAEEERRVREELQSQPKRKIRLWQVPENSADNPLPDETVCINGYVYQIKRGETVEVPESVAVVLEQAGRY